MAAQGWRTATHRPSPALVPGWRDRTPGACLALASWAESPPGWRSPKAILGCNHGFPTVARGESPPPHLTISGHLPDVEDVEFVPSLHHIGLDQLPRGRQKSCVTPGSHLCNAHSPPGTAGTFGVPAGLT